VREAVRKLLWLLDAFEERHVSRHTEQVMHQIRMHKLSNWFTKLFPVFGCVQAGPLYPKACLSVGCIRQFLYFFRIETCRPHFFAEIQRIAFLFAKNAEKTAF
jgi:hypothetical protein